jgi:hypothetical protein
VADTSAIGDPPEAQAAMKASTQLLLSAVCALGWACHNPASPASTGYAGQWNGTTNQGSAVSFTVTPGDVVTTITVGHNFNGCSGSETFPNLDISISPTVVCIPGPCSAALSSVREFGYTSGNFVQGATVDVSGLFLSTTRVEGTLNFRNYADCGTVVGVGWSATKR